MTYLLFTTKQNSYYAEAVRQVATEMGVDIKFADFDTDKEAAKFHRVSSAPCLIKRTDDGSFTITEKLMGEQQGSAIRLFFQ